MASMVIKQKYFRAESLVELIMGISGNRTVFFLIFLFSLVSRYYVAMGEWGYGTKGNFTLGKKKFLGKM